MPRISTFLAAVLIVCLAPAAANAAPDVIAAVPTDEEIRVDGHMREAAWSEAVVVSDFTQRELDEGAAPTEQTEVRVLYTEDTLYIGVLCRDSDPAGIAHKELKWDGNLSGDDSFALVLDTYNDNRMAYYFAVNPNGARIDGTITGGGEPSTQWDAIWHTESRITPEGWTCEIAIPFKSLRFPTGGDRRWGVNFRRVIRRKNEEVLWRGWRRNAGLFMLTTAGELTINREISRSRQVDVKPYVLGGLTDEEGSGSESVTRTGADVTYGITSNTTLVLTANTDFAHIESDREVINLTRFNIHYPEKRDFFLEGADTFNFTQGGTRLFYSRRIGITPDRQEQPIIGGAKLTQKTGSYRLGVMTMQTREQHGYPGANYTAFRVKKDVLEQSYVGFLATSVTDEDGGDNQLAAMDAVFRTDSFLDGKNLVVQGYLSGSRDDGDTKDNLAGRVFVSYPNDLVDSFFLYHFLEDEFTPGLGFASRVGIRNHMWYTTISPRPNIPYIKKLVFKPFNFYMNTDSTTKMITRRIEIRPLGIITNSNDEFSIHYHNEYDYVEDAFTMFDDVTVPGGVYDWWFWQASASTSRTRPVAVSLNARWGDYYNGDRTTYSGSVTLKTGAHYALSADASVNDIAVSGDSFTTREYGGRLAVDVSTRLSGSTFVQYNNYTEEVIANVRLHYIPRVGSDIFLVYNHFLDEGRDWRTLKSEGMLKLDVTWRL
jgi:hypothetical protein